MPSRMKMNVKMCSLSWTWRFLFFWACGKASAVATLQYFSSCFYLKHKLKQPRNVKVRLSKCKRILILAFFKKRVIGTLWRCPASSCALLDTGTLRLYAFPRFSLAVHPELKLNTPVCAALSNIKRSMVKIFNAELWVPNFIAIILD